MTSKYLALGLIVLAGFWIRASRMNEPVRFDEASNAIYYSGRTWAHALYSSAGNENHVLSSILGKLSLGIAGWNETALRLPPLVSGTLLIPAIFWLARRSRLNEATALAAAAVAAASPWLAYFSVNARGYIHQTLLLTLILAILVKFDDQNRARLKDLLAVAGLCALGTLAARSFLAFSGAVILACLLTARAKTGGERRKWLIAGLGTGGIYLSLLIGFYLPNIARIGIRGVLTPPANTRFPIAEAIGRTFENLGLTLGGIVWPADGWTTVACAIVVLAGAGLVRQRPLAAFAAAMVVSVALITAGSRLSIMTRVLSPAAVLGCLWLGSLFTRVVGQRHVWLPSLLAFGVVGGANWFAHGFERIHDTGHVPYARELAQSMLDLPPDQNALIDLPPLVDNSVAFVYRKAGRSLRPFVSMALNGARDENSCRFDSALVWRKGTWTGTLEPAAATASWQARAGATPAVLINGIAGGYLLRFKLAPCQR